MDGIKHTGSSRNTAPAKGAQDTGKVGSTSHSQSGDHITSATSATISSGQHETIQNIRNNPTPPAGFTSAQQQAIANRPEIVAAKAQLRTLEAAAQQPGADADTLRMQIATKKIHLIGLAAPHLPADHRTTADAYEALNSVENPASHIHPPLHGQDFGHAADATEIDMTINDMTAQNSLHIEAMRNENDPAVRTHLQAAHTLFKCDVAGMKLALSGMIDSHKFMVKQAQDQLTGLQKLEADPKTAGTVPAGLIQDAQDALERCTQALAGNVAIAKEFDDKAVNIILRGEHIGELHAKQHEPGARPRVWLGGGLPQALLSDTHFGTAKAVVDASVKNIGAKSVAGGLALSESHLLLNSAAKPLVQYGAQKLGGLVTKPVPAAYVYPSPADVITVNGQVHRLTDEEKAPLEQAIGQQRKAFGKTIGKTAMGSAKTETNFYQSFGGAHIARAAIGHFAPGAQFLLDDWRGKNLASLSGGFAAGAWSEDDKFMQTHDQIPTHTTVSPEEASLDQAWTAAKKGFVSNFNFADPANRKEHVGRFIASVIGEAVSSGVHAGVSMIGTDEKSGTGAKVANTLLTGLESPAMLQPFFAGGVTAAADAAKRLKADGTIDPKWARTADAAAMLANPNDPSLPLHGEPGSVTRRFDNSYQFMRAVMKMPAALGAETVENVVGKPIVQPIAKAVAKGVGATAGATAAYAGRKWEEFTTPRRRSSARSDDLEAAREEDVGRTTSFLPPSRRSTIDLGMTTLPPTSPLATSQDPQEGQDAITQVPPQNQ